MNVHAKESLTKMSADWMMWIDENIARGCAPEGIIDILVQNKYDRDYATNLVFAKLKGEMQSYVYESLGPIFNNRNVKTHDRDVNILFTLDQPRVILFSNVLSEDECDELIALSKPKLDHSRTVDSISGQAELHENRTSDGTFFQINELPLITRIDRRVSELMQMPIHHGEGLQILHYQHKGEYKPHFDYFPPEEAGSAMHIAQGGQRVATMILYLNDVAAGGETIFPKIDLKISPMRGNALYFAYTNSKNQVDPLTLHGGCPVLQGEKWIATKWMRQRPLIEESAAK